MQQRYVILVALGVALLFSLPAFAFLSGNAAVTTPSNNTPVAGAVFINMTFPDLANITLLYNETGSNTYGVLNFTYNQGSPFNYSWQTNNGSFPYGHYNITVIIVNASNSSDNQTIYISNITVDNLGPLSNNVSTPINLSYAGVSYVNASPTFTATVTDNSGVASCEYARNSTDTFSAIGTTIIGNATPYPISAICRIDLGSYPDKTVFNITFRARDSLGNLGANSTRSIFVVDASPPSLLFNNQNGTLYRNDSTIPISLNIADTGVNVTNGTRCAITVDGVTTTFTGGANYTNITSQCLGSITLFGITDGLHTLTVAINDTLNNTNSTILSFYTDKTPPTALLFDFTPHDTPDGYSNVTFTVVANDTNNVSAVWLTNGTYNRFFTNVSNTTRNVTFQLVANLSDFNCLNETLCNLTLVLNDTMNNVNNALNTLDGLNRRVLYIDSDAARYTESGLNVSTVTAESDVNIFARWTDVSFLDPWFSNNTADLMKFNGTTFRRTQRIIYGAGFIPGNYTNFTFTPPSSAEGTSYLFQIQFTDAENRTNTTGNLTLVVANQTPIITPAVPNDTIFAQNSTLFFTALDYGSGFNWSTFLVVNLSTQQANLTFNSSANASYFNCSCPTCNLSNGTSGAGNDGTLSNWTCILKYPWSMGNVTLGLTVSDSVGNVNKSSYRYFVTNIIPDIVNLTINGYQLPQTVNTTAAVINYSYSNASAETEINWSVLTNLSVTSTGIAFLNVSPNQERAFLAAPNGTHYNITAGKSSLVINASAGSILLFDTLQLNIVANVPLNLSAIAAQYARGLVSSFSTYLNGQLATDAQFVNATTDIVLGVLNTSATVPYNATINYTGANGLSLRWNATTSAFSVLPATSMDDLLRGGQTNTNVTVHIKSSAPNWLFFDQQQVLTVMSFNFTIAYTNLSVFYTRSNITTNTTTILSACGAVPTSPIADAAACYVTSNITNITTLYLPRFDENDEVFFGNAAYAPIASFTLPSTINQSVIPLVLTVKTTVPATGTFCYYNLSMVNTSGKVVSWNIVTIPFLSFARNGTAWQYATNIQGIADYNSGNYYNMSINCSDAYGRTGAGWQSFIVADSTKPTFQSDPTAGSITMTSGVISATTDELATFTVKYGATPSSLTSSSTGSSTPVSNDNISLAGLDLGTRVYYNVTACDAKSQCTMVGPFSFSTLTAPPGAGSSGGGGGGGAAGSTEHIVGKVETSDARSWAEVAQGQTVAYDTRNDVAFTHILLHFTAFSESPRMTIRQFKDKPETLPSLPTVYKYLHIEHSGIVDNTDARVIDFTIPKQWLADNGVGESDIALYRLENNAWVAYKAEQKSTSTLTITYNVSLPGFSYFAIGKYDEQLRPTVVENQTTPTTPPPVVTPPSTGTGESVANSTGGGEFQVNDTKKGFHIPTWLTIAFIAVLAALGAVVGMQQYKKYQERSVVRQADLRESYDQDQRRKQMGATVVRTDEHDPMAPAHHYIEHMRAKGTSDADIREKLVSVGWDPMVVDLELLKDAKK